MGSTIRAIETTGIVDEQHRLHLDEPLSITGPSRVRVIILVPEEAKTEEGEWLRAAASSSVFDFLKDVEEDIYSPADGRPFCDEG